MNSERTAEIRRRAFEIYLERRERTGDGDELGDWLKAESEVETQGNSGNYGPARSKGSELHNGVVDVKGHDIENPT